MSKPLLNRPHRRASSAHPSPEGMAKVVEADVPESRASDRGLKTFAELGAVVRRPEQRVAEDKIEIARVRRSLKVEIELGSQGVRERHSSHRPPRLRGAELSARETSSH